MLVDEAGQSLLRSGQLRLALLKQSSISEFLSACHLPFFLAYLTFHVSLLLAELVAIGV